MRAKVTTLFCLCLLLTAAAPGSAGTGKYYIVGMGTAPDLLTIRGAEVIKRADVILVGDKSDGETWKKYIGNKEVWYCPNSLRSMYGIDPRTIADPARRALAEKNAQARKELADKIRAAVEGGRIVAHLQSADPMMFGLTFLLEMLPKELPSEIVPGIGSYQAAAAAVKMSPPYGYDTNGVILTAADWPGRLDTNEKLMTPGSTMVFYTMHLDYPALFSQLQRHYAADTPVAVVIDAGDRIREKVVRSTVGRFLQDVDYKNLPPERELLFVGKFLTAGQARKTLVIERGK